MVLLGRFRRARELGRRRPVTVGAWRDAAAGANQPLRVRPPHLEIGALVRGLLAALGGRLLARRRSPGLLAFRLSFCPFLYDVFLVLEVPFPGGSGDGARQHRTVQAAIDDDLDE